MWTELGEKEEEEELQLSYRACAELKDGKPSVMECVVCGGAWFIRGNNSEAGQIASAGYPRSSK
jgi:hypothetical protein